MLSQERGRLEAIEGSYTVHGSKRVGRSYTHCSVAGVE